jgi:hypothetical protein
VVFSFYFWELSYFVLQIFNGILNVWIHVVEKQLSHLIIFQYLKLVLFWPKDCLNDGKVSLFKNISYCLLMNFGIYSSKKMDKTCHPHFLCVIFNNFIEVLLYLLLREEQSITCLFLILHDIRTISLHHILQQLFFQFIIDKLRLKNLYYYFPSISYICWTKCIYDIFVFLIVPILK